MIRNSRIFGGPSTKARKAVSRWRVFCMAVVLSLWVGSAGQPFSAQAAPAATSIDIWLTVARRNGNQTICVGDTVPISATVWKKVEGGKGEGAMYGTLFGVDVHASVVDPNIGSINPPNQATPVYSSPPGRVLFTFKAKNPGTTLIQFWGKVSSKVFMGLEVSSSEVRTELDVKVENCEYKVNTYSRWVQQGGTFTVTARINGAGMFVDEPGHYTGEAQVEWTAIPNVVAPGCTVGHISIPQSTAKLTGELRNNTFLVDISYSANNYEPVKLSCPGLPGSPSDNAESEFKVTPGTLIFEFPVSGGTDDDDQSLTHFPSGRVSIVVYRVTDQ